MQEDLESTRRISEECQAHIQQTARYPDLELTLSRAHLFSGKPEESLRILEGYKERNLSHQESPVFHLQLSEVLAALNDYKGALAEYKTFLEMNREIARTALDADTKYVEEKYESEIRELHNKEKRNTIAVTGLIILAILVILFRYIMRALEIVRNELTESERRFRELTKEHDALNSIIKHATSVDEETFSLLNERRNVIENILLSYISSDPVRSKEAERGITQLISDKKGFIESNSRLFSVRYPKLNAYLKQAGLDDIEIGYCSLNMMGLQTKELDKLLGVRTRKSLSLSIHEKLGTTKNEKIRLKTYLTNKEKELLDNNDTEPKESIVRFA